VVSVDLRIDDPPACGAAALSLANDVGGSVFLSGVGGRLAEGIAVLCAVW